MVGDDNATALAGETAVVWFRRDLRLHDHPALTAALRGFRPARARLTSMGYDAADDGSGAPAAAAPRKRF